jgi:hypothetical protein
LALRQALGQVLPPARARGMQQVPVQASELAPGLPQGLGRVTEH